MLGRTVGGMAVNTNGGTSPGIPGIKEITVKLSTGELISRLKALMNYLSEADQEANTTLIAPYAASLVKSGIIHNPDKDVRLLVACCLADVLRIFAPDAPYTEPELKTIFTLFTEQLRGIELTASPNFSRVFYLLESLAIVKSFVICTELRADDIILDLFKMLFEIVSEKHAHNVISHMLDIMASVIEEGQGLNQDMLEIVFQNILEPNKTDNPVAFSLAKTLIVRTTNSLQPHVHEFFANLLNGGESELSDRVYDLIQELSSLAPNTLLYVLPQLEEQLKVEDQDIRLKVTRLLGLMFAAKDSDLVRVKTSLWVGFLKRSNDISPAIRTEMVNHAKNVMVNHPENAREVAEELKKRINDADEKVRLAAVGAVVDAVAHNADAVPYVLLQTISERILDKKFAIRKEAANGLGALYQSIVNKHGDAEEWTSDLSEKYAWIPTSIMSGYHLDDISTRLVIERVFDRLLVSHAATAEERARQLASVYASLDVKAEKGFQQMLKAKRSVMSDLEGYINARQSKDIEGADEKIAALAARLPDITHPREHLKKVHDARDAKIVKLLEACVSAETPVEDLRTTRLDIIKRLGPKHSSVDTMKDLVDRASITICTRETLLALIRLVQEATAASGKAAQELPSADKIADLIVDIARVHPERFHVASTFEELVGLLGSDSPFLVELSLQLFGLVGTNVQDIAPGLAKALSKELGAFAVSGTQAQAKYAMRAIATVYPATKAKIFDEIMSDVVPKLKSPANQPSALAPLVAAAGHVALLAPRSPGQVQGKVDHTICDRRRTPKA
eukprot:Opistho-2@36195